MHSGKRLFGRLTAAVSEFANGHGLYLGRRSGRIHAACYRWTGGRFGGRVPGWPEARILLLDHVGARSGIKRSSPVIYLREGDVVAVAAAKAGQPTHPAWFHNLRAHPDTTIRIGRELRAVRARVAGEQERARLWPQLVAIYPSYEFFQRSAGDRRIPIVLLEPR